MKAGKRTISLRLKLVAPLAISILIGLGFAAAIVLGTSEDARKLGESVRNLEFLSATSRLIQEIQDERGLTELFMEGEVEKPELDAQYQETDKKIADFRSRLLASRIPDVVKEKAQRGIDSLADFRTRVDPGNKFVSFRNLYSISLSSLTAVMPVIAEEERGTEFGSPISSIVLLEEAKDAGHLIRSLVPPILKSGEPITQDEATILLNTLGRMIVNMDSPAVSLTAGQSALGILRDLSARHQAEEAIRKIYGSYSRGNYEFKDDRFYEQVTTFVDMLAATIQAEIAQQLSVTKAYAEEGRKLFLAVTFSVAAGYTAAALLSLAVILAVVRSARTVFGFPEGDRGGRRGPDEAHPDQVDATSWASLRGISTTSRRNWRGWCARSRRRRKRSRTWVPSSQRPWKRPPPPPCRSAPTWKASSAGPWTRAPA